MKRCLVLLIMSVAGIAPLAHADFFSPNTSANASSAASAPAPTATVPLPQQTLQMVTQYFEAAQKVYLNSNTFNAANYNLPTQPASSNSTSQGSWL